MHFQAAAALMIAAFAANVMSSPSARNEIFERQAGCNCACATDCSNNCANGFSEYASSQGICIATCTDSCGCDQDTLCCQNGSNCKGYGCCAPQPIPNNDAGYAPGWCGLHVTQYQKPDPSTDSYGLEVNIFDANGVNIGGTGGEVGPSASIGSKLPWTVEVSTGGVDADPVSFAYADQSWDSNDGSRCSVGAYDSGSRNMDCGFTC